MSQREMEDEFRVYGVLRSVWVARKPPGFAFIEFEDRRDAEDAIKGSNGLDLAAAAALQLATAAVPATVVPAPPSPVRRPRSPGYGEDRNGHSSRRHRSPSPVYRSRHRSPDRRSPRQSRSRSYDSPPRRADYSPKRRSRSPPPRRRSVSRSPPPRQPLLQGVAVAHAAAAAVGAEARLQITCSLTIVVPDGALLETESMMLAATKHGYPK
eukprot:SM000068S20622  [mRNA]  locus=s68:623042:625557:+ [translate_table: standard]